MKLRAEPVRYGGRAGSNSSSTRKFSISSRLWVRSLALGALVASHINAFAGFPSGPYYVWADLTQQADSPRTSALHEYLKSEVGTAFCDDSAYHWIVYTHKRPPAFSDALLAKAIKSRDAQTKLARLLRDFRDKGIDDGLDGVIFYTETGGPKMVSVDAHGLVRTKPVLDPGDAGEVMKQFCGVAPPSYRR